VLKNPPHMYRNDPVLRMMEKMDGWTKGVVSLGEGLFQIGHFSGDMLLFGGNDCERSYTEFSRHPEFGAYGVCDSPEQFMRDWGEVLEHDERIFTVTFTHVKKHPEKKGQGGGWRWHKWGDYVGKGKPECEYLDDEDGFEDGVYCYHVYDITGLT